MYQRARQIADDAGSMTRRAQLMAGEDHQSRQRLAATRRDLAAAREAHASPQSPRAEEAHPALTPRCATCGLWLLPDEDRQRCHRCRDETCEQARIDWETAKTIWTAASERAAEGVDAADPLHPVRALGPDLERAAPGVPEMGEEAALEQSEIEWEQARTAWSEAQMAQNERSRRDADSSSGDAG